MTPVIHQRVQSDCGLSALASFIADRAARRVDPKMRGLTGLYSRELVAAAKTLGFTLRETRRFNLDTDEGILRLRWNDAESRAASPSGHFVALLSGSIHCGTQHVALPWRDYIVRFNARTVSLLRFSA